MENLMTSHNRRYIAHRTPFTYTRTATLCTKRSCRPNFPQITQRYPQSPIATRYRLSYLNSSARANDRTGIGWRWSAFIVVSMHLKFGWNKLTWPSWWTAWSTRSTTTTVGVRNASILSQSSRSTHAISLAKINSESEPPENAFFDGLAEQTVFNNGITSCRLLAKDAILGVGREGLGIHSVHRRLSDLVSLRFPSTVVESFTSRKGRREGVRWEMAMS